MKSRDMFPGGPEAVDISSYVNRTTQPKKPKATGTVAKIAGISIPEMDGDVLAELGDQIIAM